MAYILTITNVSNNFTVAQPDNSVAISQTSTAITINPNAIVIQTKNTADTYRGAWVSGRVYFRGDTVTFGNILYLATSDVTSATNPASDTTNWTQYVVASSTSTFVRLTATNAIVAKANAIFAFEDTSSSTQSTIALNTGTYQTLEILAPAGGVRITGGGAFYATSGAFTTSVSIGTGLKQIYGDNNGVLSFYYNNPISGTQTPLQLSINTATNSGVIAGTNVNIQGNTSVLIETDYSNGNIQLNGLVSLRPASGAQWNYSSGGFYAGSVKVIDNSGNWVGPAITDNPQQRVEDITSSTQIQLDSFAVSVYDTAKYLLKLRDGNNIHVAEIILMYDGTNIHKSEYGVITNNGSLGTFQSDVAGGNVRLLLTPSSPTDMSVRIEKILMAV